MLLPLILLSSSISPPHLQGPLPADCYIATGFMIPKKQYDSFSLELVQENICRSRITFLEDENDLSNKLDIPSSSSRLRQFLPEDKTNWVLIGHSRGAAVAAYSSASMEPSKKPNALVLIDPVDDERSTTIEYIRTSHHFPRTYIVSTPFGGRSRYYKNAIFESSCAPPSRSSSAFYETISTRLKDDSEAIATDYKDVVKGNKIEYVPEVVLKEYKNIGHLQLLNDRQELFRGNSNMCASNEEEEARLPEIRNEIARGIYDFLSQDKVK